MFKKIFNCCMRSENKTKEADFSDFFIINNLEKNINSEDVENINLRSTQCQILKPSEEQEVTQANYERSIFNSKSNEFVNPLQNFPINLVSDAEIQENANLEIFEKEGNLANEIIRINAGGLENSKKQIKDGIVRFGHNKANLFITRTVSNDINFDLQNPPDASTLFQIYFDKVSKSFFMTNENKTDELHVLFIKLDSAFKLTKKHVLSLGELHLSAEIDDLTKNLKLETVYRTEETKTRVFNVEQNKIVKLGRNTNNDIVLEKGAFSRVHTIFFWDEQEDSWFVKDGFEDKPSTNGTWIFLDWPWEIKNSIFFRFSSSMFYLKKADK